MQLLSPYGITVWFQGWSFSGGKLVGDGMLQSILHTRVCSFDSRHWQNPLTSKKLQITDALNTVKLSGLYICNDFWRVYHCIRYSSGMRVYTWNPNSQKGKAELLKSEPAWGYTVRPWFINIDISIRNWYAINTFQKWYSPEMAFDDFCASSSKRLSV